MGSIVRVGVQWYYCGGGCTMVLLWGRVYNGIIVGEGVQWYYCGGGCTMVLLWGRVYNGTRTGEFGYFKNKIQVYQSINELNYKTLLLQDSSS